MTDEHELLDLVTDFMNLTVDPETQKLSGVSVCGIHIADDRFTRAVSMAMEWLDTKRAQSN